MTADQIKERLRELAPNVFFSVGREIDWGFRWDGDGEDPVDKGFDAYDVDVTARAIVKGAIIEGSSSLGGCYFQGDEPIDDIHGYLPQMLIEAAEELGQQVQSTSDIHGQLTAAIAMLKQEMEDRYNEQLNQIHGEPS